MGKKTRQQRRKEKRKLKQLERRLNPLPSAPAFPPFRQQMPLQGMVSISTMRSFSGPLPAPEDLQGFKDVDPSFPDRIVKHFEKEQIHRHEREKKLVDAGIANAARGQYIAFAVAIAGLALCAFAVSRGGATATGGLALAGGGLATLVGVFLKNKSDAKKDEQQAAKKAEQQVDPSSLAKQTPP